MRGDLEDRVGGGVDDPLAGLLVLLAVLLDHLGARGRLVAENAAAGAVHERVDHLVREAVWVGRESHGRDNPHQLPVTCCRVLALGALEQPSGDRRRAGLRRAAFKRLDVPEAESLEIGQVEAPDGTGDVSERVRALVPPLGSIWQLTRADGIEHDHAGPRHAGSLRTDGNRSRTGRADVLRARDPLALGGGHVRRGQDLAHQDLEAPGRQGPDARPSAAAPVRRRSHRGAGPAKRAGVTWPRRSSASGVYASPWACATAS